MGAPGSNLQSLEVALCSTLWELWLKKGNKQPLGSKQTWKCFDVYTLSYKTAQSKWCNNTDKNQTNSIYTHLALKPRLHKPPMTISQEEMPHQWPSVPNKLKASKKLDTSSYYFRIGVNHETVRGLKQSFRWCLTGVTAALLRWEMLDTFPNNARNHSRTHRSQIPIPF